jgi:hypothetical protein
MPTFPTNKFIRDKHGMLIYTWEMPAARIETLLQVVWFRAWVTKSLRNFEEMDTWLDCK